jgi:hypothetical protein
MCPRRLVRMFSRECFRTADLLPCMMRKRYTLVLTRGSSLPRAFLETRELPWLWTACPSPFPLGEGQGEQWSYMSRIPCMVGDSHLPGIRAQI